MEGKLLVAAYCRVSTDSRDQANSLENQKNYFDRFITHNDDWSFVKMYVDEGITGTSIRKRNAFQEMLEDAYNHRFQMIITKEISRFARNTLDSIYYTRRLKDLGIGIIFLNDNINTLDSDAELRLTIMSSIAQEESRKISERVKWGQRRSMEQGIVFGRALLGYDVADGSLRINEREADIVKLIFSEYLEKGKGAARIASELRDAATPTAPYMKEWTATAIRRILRNEKYCGDLKQRKTYTPNYLTHEKKQNKGEEEYVTVRNHHEPIIDREIFLQVQKELNRRGRKLTQRSRYSNRYCFSGKIRCGECHVSYVSRSKKRQDGSEYRSWRCSISLRQSTPCRCLSVNEEHLRRILCEVIHELPLSSKEIVDNMINLLRGCGFLGKEESSRKIREQLSRKLDILKRRKERLLELYVMEEVALEEYRKLDRKLCKEIDELERKLGGKEERSTNRLEKNFLEKAVILEKESNQEKTDIIDKENNLEKEPHLHNESIFGKSDLNPLSSSLLKNSIMNHISIDEEVDIEARDNRDLATTKEQGIRDYLYSIITGELWDEQFYKRILDSVVIYQDSISVSLSYIPGEWRYRMSSL
jgi:DNA invertase Pin-like site-specific DNA recombinase